MTRHAAHAITGQSSIDVRVLVVTWRIRIVSSVNQLSLEITFIRSAVIVIQSTLTHHAMTLEARVVDLLNLLRHLNRIVFEKTFYESNLAVQLCVENRIAAGQSHRRPTPLAV